MRPDSNCGFDGYLCLTARRLIPYDVATSGSRRHHIFENRGCGWHPCCTSRVHSSLHPMIQLRYTRLIYVGNCRTILSPKLDGQLTSSYERVRKTLNDSFSLKHSDIIHSLFPIPARGSSHGKVGHQHLSMEDNSGEVGRPRNLLRNRILLINRTVRTTTVVLRKRVRVRVSFIHEQQNRMVYLKTSSGFVNGTSSNHSER
jgi:hypothetical protein